MPQIESIMLNSANTPHGWTKTNEPFGYRVIKIGNTRNCNDDGIIKNLWLNKNISEVLNKYEINDYIMNEINTNSEYSIELKLSENTYIELINKMSQKKYVNEIQFNNSVCV